LWSEKANPRAIAEERKFLYRALKIGQFGCVCYVIYIVSDILALWIFSNLFSDGSIDYVLFGYLANTVNLLSRIAYILLAIGYYALLRSNGSRLAIPYVFLSLIANSANWSLFLSLISENMTLIWVLSSAIGATFALILVRILWTINGTVSDRKLLKNIILLMLVNLAYTYLISNLISIFVLITTFFHFILLRAPNMLSSLALIVLVFRLFGQDQVIVIDDVISPTTSFE
jgi:hypothetical protein